MAKLTKETISYLAELSRIHCTEQEAEALLGDLEKIVDYVEQLKEIDTEGVHPCDHVLEGIVNVMREDKVGETLPREVFLANSPDQIGGMIRVPPVIKSKERT